MKTFLVMYLSAVMLLTPVAQATQIHQFDKMNGDDQIDYVDLLAQSVEDATAGAEHTRVHRFFMPKQPGETISGMGQFEMNLSLARIADLEAVQKNPQARRLEVEDVMYVTLERNGIILPKSFRPVATNFHPKRALSPKTMTMLDAQKALAETQAWVSRTVDAPRELHRGTLSGFSSNDKAIAFFAALALLAIAANKAGGGSSAPSSDYDPHAADPWWQKSGYPTYGDAVKAACLGSTTAANPSWCY